MGVKFKKSKETAPRINMSNCVCEEASTLSKETYIGCGHDAHFLVWHDRDRRAYTMCLGCAYHNVDNRGGILVGVDANL